MGLDWERLSLSGYFEALEAHNEAHDPQSGKAADPESMARLKAFMKARAG